MAAPTASTTPKFTLPLSPSHSLPVTRTTVAPSTALPEPKATKSHPQNSSASNNASLYFIGTATTILEWNGIRLMTDPNFLHDGDHVHLGPGVTAQRVTNPAVELEKLPSIDAVLLTHYHADHFDQKVEAELRRDLPIITTPHAYNHLSSKPGDEAFTSVHALDHYQTGILTIPDSGGTLDAAIKITGTPGKHVPPGPGGILAKANDLLGAVPPTNGWMIELGGFTDSGHWLKGYRIYISGDTLVIPELKDVAEKYKHLGGVDLMLVHLGGTTIPGKSIPLLMVTMDAKMGVEMIRMFEPEVTVPIHYDDYDVFLSPLEHFKKEVTAAGFDDKVVYLDRGDAFKFEVKMEE